MRYAWIPLLSLAVSSGAQQQSASKPSAKPDQLRVLVWNIQRGANKFENGPEKALRVIRDARPDLCLLQESYDIDGPRPKLGAWLAQQLGWNQWQGDSTHLCVLTPLAIRKTRFHAKWHGVGARIADRRGREFLAYSIWIDYRAYTPYHLRDVPTATDEELLALERKKSKRLIQTRAILEHLRTTDAMTKQLPLLVGGDWNCPSHLDWTTHTAAVFRFRRPLSLPVSRAMIDAGFVDAFREFHPDPVRTPGITWSPLAAGSPEKPETADRIDRLYSLPPTTGWMLRPAAGLVLPRVHEDPAIPQAKRAFPSDHAAVVIAFDWVELSSTTQRR